MASVRPTSGLNTEFSSWSLQVPFSKKKYIDEIPPEKMQKLCTEIDYTIHINEGYWQKLVGKLGFDETSSKRYRLSFEMHGSPTDNLLRDCRYRMVRIRHLYQILMEIGLVQLAQEVLGEFDTEEELPPLSCLNRIPANSPSRVVGENSFLPNQNFSAPTKREPKWSGLETYHFDFNEIRRGTNDFSHSLELGAGAFGKVYKVTLSNTLYACKVLKIDKDNPFTTSIIETHRKHDDLRNELNYLAEYRHPNIITLYGWSLDGPDPCLVYEFMSNGSLQDRLQCVGNARPLTWEQRVKISCGAARGLQFLHTMKAKPLIHGDIKTANILLDESYTAKLGDFGLAREMPTNASTGSYIRLDNEHTPGTLGYLADEYVKTKKLSVQVDTYAFGVVLLELYTGRRAFDRNTETPLLRDYMHNVAGDDIDDLEKKAREKLLMLRDPQIPPMSDENLLKNVCLALKCCAIKRTKRPKMKAALEQLVEIDKSLTATGYLYDSNYQQRKMSSQFSRKCPTETDDHSLLLEKKPNKSHDEKPPAHHSVNEQFEHLRIRRPPSSSDDTDSMGRSSIDTTNRSYYIDPEHQRQAQYYHPSHPPSYGGSLSVRSVDTSIDPSIEDSNFSSHVHSESIDANDSNDIYTPGPFKFNPVVPPGPPDNPFNLDLSRVPKSTMYHPSTQDQITPTRQSSKWTADEDCAAEVFTSLDLHTKRTDQMNKYQSRGDPAPSNTSSKVTTPLPGSFHFPSPASPHPPYDSSICSSYPPVSINACKESIIDKLKEGAETYTQIFRDSQSSKVPTESSTDY